MALKSKSVSVSFPCLLCHSRDKRLVVVVHFLILVYLLWKTPMNKMQEPEMRFGVPVLSLALALALHLSEANSLNPQTSRGTRGLRLCSQRRGLWAKGTGWISPGSCKASSQAGARWCRVPGSHSPWSSRWCQWLRCPMHTRHGDVAEKSRTVWVSAVQTHPWPVCQQQD